MTGGTSGFGRHAVERVIRELPGWRVLLLARPSPRMEGFPAAPDGRRVEIIPVDLTSLASVDDACTEVLGRLGDEPIDVLALNAGIQEFDNDRISLDGFERTFAVNHLAHFAIADRLIGQMRSDGGRIVITGSEVHDPEAFCLVGIARATWQDPADLADVRRSQADVEAGVERGEARYSASKLLNVMHARLLAHQAPNLRAVSFNPSVVPGTGIARERNFVQRLFWDYVLPPLAPVLPGARSIARSGGDLFHLLTEAEIRPLHEATRDPQNRTQPLVPVSGDYVDGRTPQAGSAESRDASKIARMRAVSLQLLAEVRQRRQAQTSAHAARGR